MPSRKRISEETKALIRVLKMTSNLTLNEIAERFQVPTASVHRVTTSKYKEVHESRRHLSGRKKKLTPEHEALILTTIEELREQEGSFSSRRLMEQTGIHHVTDRTVRRLLNGNGYFFLQARKKGLMSQSDKERRVEFARQMQSNYPQSVWTDTIAFYLQWGLVYLQDQPHGPSPSTQRESMVKKIRRSKTRVFG